MAAVNGSDANDDLYGTAEADTFIYSARRFGRDTITDFTPGADRIDLSGVGVSSFAALQPYIMKSGADAVITLGYGGEVERITLRGVDPALLTADDFVFFQDPNPVFGKRLVPGSPGDDIIFGSTNNDVFFGLDGTDRVDGDGGVSDELSYQFRENGPGLSVVAGDRTITVTSSNVVDSAGQFNTMFVNIEQITLDSDTAHGMGFATGETTIDASTFAGEARLRVTHKESDGPLIFQGSAGNDSLDVGQGHHVLNGGAGHDDIHFRFDGAVATVVTQSGTAIRTSDGNTIADASNFETVGLRLNSARGGVINAAGVTSSLVFATAYGTGDQSLIGGSGHDRFENHLSGATYAIGVD